MQYAKDARTVVQFDLLLFFISPLALSCEIEEPFIMLYRQGNDPSTRKFFL